MAIAVALDVEYTHVGDYGPKKRVKAMSDAYRKKELLKGLSHNWRNGK